jgi:hypothetical protein
MEAERREIQQSRYTSLDRMINRENAAPQIDATDGGTHFVVSRDTSAVRGEFAKRNRAASAIENRRSYDQARFRRVFQPWFGWASPRQTFESTGSQAGNDPASAMIGNCGNCARFPAAPARYLNQWQADRSPPHRVPVGEPH